MDGGKHSLYALIDRDGQPRYVGKTAKSLPHRWRQHITEATNTTKQTHKLKWIRKCLREGYAPTIQLLEVVGTADDADRAERRIIRMFREWNGFNLTNGTAGGEGCYSPTPETRRRISEGLRGRVMSPETRRKLSELNKGKAGPNRGRVFDAEFCRRVSEGKKRKMADPAYRAKCIAALDRGRAVQMRLRAERRLEGVQN